MPGKPEAQETIATIASAAGASALRRVSLMRAPSGRAFAAIATLTELSRRIEASLESAAGAVKIGDEKGAEAEWARSKALMEGLAAGDQNFGAHPQERPSYLRKSAGSEG
ncbi:hypothetical protein BH10PSE7_BH10PSE7_32990 [soil metagenome]